jgi:N-carbamoyl-L-amino-acid hydrolase
VIRGLPELHIEQGGNLDREKLDIGVVEGIVGIGWWDVTIEGFANHAAPPMDKRRDALLAAAKYVQMVNRVVTSEPGRQVGTVGRMQAFPGAPNVIPGQVQATLEIRDLDQAKIVRLARKVMDEATKIGAENGTTFTFKETYLSTPAIMNTSVQKTIEASAKGLNLTTKYLPSGAGHDAQYMAQIAPTGMIFCPSAGGISHSPKDAKHDVSAGDVRTNDLGLMLRRGQSAKRSMKGRSLPLLACVARSLGDRRTAGERSAKPRDTTGNIGRAMRVEKPPVLGGR